MVVRWGGRCCLPVSCEINAQDAERVAIQMFGGNGGHVSGLLTGGGKVKGRLCVIVSRGLCTVTPQCKLLAATLYLCREGVWRLRLAVLQNEVDIRDFAGSPVIPRRFTVAELSS